MQSFYCFVDTGKSDLADAQAAGRPVALLGFLVEPGGRQHQDFGFVLLRRGVSRPWRGAHRSGAVARLLNQTFAGMNALFDQHGFPEHELEAMSMGLVALVAPSEE
jgi:hypothetical protein